VAEDSEYATSREEGVVNPFSRTWQGMSGDTPIEEQYILESPDSYQIFTKSMMDAFDRMQQRWHRGRFEQIPWAGRGFNGRDGESTT
jgi:hypothetical protein